MTRQLAARIEKMEESATIRMASMARELKSQGVDVIDLSLGEPDFGTPHHIKEAAKAAIDAGFSHYPPVPGYADLREGICLKFRRDNGLDYSPEQIVVSTGAKQSIANVVLSLINPGDEVVLATPYWVSYEAIANLAEAKIAYAVAGIESDFKLTPDVLENALSSESRLFIFSSPCNPTGAAYNEEEMAALAAVFRQYPDLYIISDEIYEYIRFEGKHVSLAGFEGMKDRVITVNGVSKGYAMTGWRIGYIGAPLHVAKACAKMQGQFTSGANTIAQKAALAAITGDHAEVEAMRQAFQKRRDFLLDALGEIEGMVLNRPEGAFYLFPDVSAFFGRGGIENADQMAEYLLREANVSLVSGGAFGAPNCIRLSYAVKEATLARAVERIATGLAKLS